MATTAPAMASLSVPGVAEDMDIQSDSGYGYGDGDIDIDLESTGADVHADDNDLELQDAATDVGDGFQADGPELDLFMDDDENSLELGGDVDITDAGESSHDDSGSAEQDTATRVDTQRGPTVQATLSVAPQPTTATEANPEEDIIDYTTDEDEPQKVNDNESPLGYGLAHLYNEGEGARASEQGNSPEHDLHGNGDNHHLGGGADEKNHDYTEHYDDFNDNHEENAEQTWDDQAQAEWPDQENEDDTYADVDYEDDVHQEPSHALSNPTHDGDAHGEGEASSHSEHQDEDEEHDASRVQHDDDINTNQQHEGNADERSHEEDHEGESEAQNNEEPRLHSVMLNYDGTEMCLFAPHSDQEPQMFLLSDETVATTTFHALFQACRVQLGGSIKRDTELGLRIKDLKNFEIYEDSIACASFNLKNLLDIYLSLHTQDGTTNPGPLHLKFLFRTRVIALYSDLQKAVRDQVGYSGLQHAKASEHTDFDDTEFEYQADEDHEGWDHAGEELRVDAAEEQAEPRELSDDEDEQGDSNSRNAEQATDPVPDDTAGPSAHISATEEDHESENAKETDQAAQSSVNSSAAAAEAEEDFIDYADDEERSNLDQNGQGSLKELSSGSSTVQGDNVSFAATAHDLTNPADSFDEQLDYNLGEGFEDDHQNQEVDYTQEELHTGNDTFDENGSLNLESHLLPGPADTADNDNLLEGFDYDAGAGDDGTFEDLLGELPQTDGTGEFEGTIDFVNLDNGEGLATEPAVGDGDAGQDASASQSGHLDLDSPQGLKRSIDEVDGGAVPSDQSDDKRVRL